MDHAQQTLEKLLKEIADDLNYTDPDIQVQPIASDGANFSSYLYTGTISGSHEKIGVFGKVVAIGDKFRYNPIMMKIFETEGFVYEELMNTYAELEKEHGVDPKDRLQVPKFYGRNPDVNVETIVLEDLTLRGFEQHDRVLPITWEYASAAVTELAKFHALSFAYKQEFPDDFQDVATKLRFDWEDMSEEMMKPMHEQLMKNATGYVKDEKRDRLIAHLTRLQDEEDAVQFYALNSFSVLRHGDYRPSNLMHKVHDDGSITVIPVDYQMVQPGCLTMDLLYLIITGTDEEFRRNHYERLIDHYYDQLSKAMERLGVDPGTYPRETFDEHYRKKLSFGILIAVSTLPLVLVSSTNAPELGSELDIGDLLNATAGDDYIERLDGILNDFIKWGVL